MLPDPEVIESVVKPFTDRHQRLPQTHDVEDGGCFFAVHGRYRTTTSVPLRHEDVIINCTPSS